ncbi:DUF3465 domain-containing protein [Pontiellaceae bacterium B1224]|nr:DUF3465 domain-containing protein [Pontiellaceae bacterium B1224]
MRRIFTALLLLGLILGGALILPKSIIPSALAGSSQTALTDAYKNKKSNVPVTGVGTVTRVLKDDTDGSRHQRFILQITPTQTILIAHNIDLAPRVDSIKVGDSISFKGIFEWNSKGGVVHWTHHDPAGKHAAGWLKKRHQSISIKYQYR